MNKGFMLMVLAIIIGIGVVISTNYTRIVGFATESKSAEFYTLDVVGENVRVYEFSPKADNNVTCVMVFTESTMKSPVMQCFKK